MAKVAGSIAGGLFVLWVLWRGLQVCQKVGADRHIFMALWIPYAYGWYRMLDDGNKSTVGPKLVTTSTLVLLVYMFFCIIRYLRNLTKRGGPKKRASLKIGELTDVDRKALQRQMQEARA